MKTIDVIKEKRVVSEKLKEHRKECARLKKLILNALKEGEKTIPQIAEEINEPLDMVTYSLMTSRKYGAIETGEIDDMDEYYTYKIAKKKK